MNTDVMLTNRWNFIMCNERKEEYECDDSDLQMRGVE